MMSRPATDPATRPRLRGAELSVIVPTFREHDNVDPLLAKLETALAGIAWEVVFVDDDSTDGTAARVRERAREDHRVRCVQRIGRRGLSSACVEGVLASAAPVFAVIDGDMQHDETLLPKMLALINAEPIDLVIGSRYIAGGDAAGGFTGARSALSRAGNKLGRLVLKAEVSDPMSGFFMMRREAFEGAVRNLSGIGFKILLDLFASSPRPLRFRELAYSFRSREHGASKLDSQVAWEYMMLLADKLVGHIVPVRLILFVLVGASGVAVHLATLKLALTAGVGFEAAQGVATGVAMLSNFLANNWFTYRDRRLKGWNLVKGFLSFVAVCGAGAVANVAIAGEVYDRHYAWWVAGVAGAAVSSLWNYALTSLFTWKSPQAPRKS